MKNYEKYAEEIREYKGHKGRSICSDFIKPHILEADNCDWVDCRRCFMLQMLWLLEDYKEPEVDWSKVAVDTPILVRDSEDEDWYRRYFAKYKNRKVFAWRDGRTSWNETDVRAWDCAELAEDEEE